MKNYERMVNRVSTATLLRVSLLARLLVESEVERQSLIVCRLVLKTIDQLHQSTASGVFACS
jgi:hypothetical protein